MPKARKPLPILPARATANERLDAIGIDAICTRLASGESQTEIAASLKINIGTFGMWLARPANVEASNAARAISARIWDDKAASVLLTMEDGPLGITRARELASHYRWRSKCYAPRDYGEKSQVDIGNKDKQPFATINLSSLSDDELAAYITLQSKIEQSP